MERADALTLRAAKKFGTPLYVYEQSVIEDQCRKLKRYFPEVAFHYAMKANSNPAVLAIIRKEGIGCESVSLGELTLAQKAGFNKNAMSFTCSNITERELTEAAASGVRVHLDSLEQLRNWGRLKLGREVSLRLNQGIGAGHHAHVITGGPNSKFGITLKDIPEAMDIAKKFGLRITGIQQHIGSNVLEVETFLKAARTLLKTARTFSDLEHIDFGGGIGVPYHTNEKQLDLKALGKEFKILIREFQKNMGKSVSFAMEPGRFLVAEAGSLLVTVVDLKSTEKHQFAGVNSGFNQLVRPAMYGSYHQIDNLSRSKGKRGEVTVAGNVCESGDILASKRTMLIPEIADVLAIRNAGAYGFSMASFYNLRALPREVLITSAGAMKDISFVPGDFVR
ncbi:MAG: diaminopimelate decarboxylase [Parcubacteria bacterium C7867-004]|nr:MAG: diaminopimelate decarboxylase [Parcubacteria bacterium C7867-004]